MASTPPGDRSPSPRRRRNRGYRPIKGQGSIQAGMYWSHQVTSMSIGLIAPILIGWWLDSRFDTKPWCMVVGALLGFVLLMTRLVQMITPPADVVSQPRSAETDTTAGTPPEAQQAKNDD